MLVFPESRKSISRPGVAMHISTPAHAHTNRNACMSILHTHTHTHTLSSFRWVYLRMYVPLSSSLIWGPLEAPPYTQQVRIPAGKPNWLATPSTCWASSRVGANTRTWVQKGNTQVLLHVLIRTYVHYLYVRMYTHAYVWDIRIYLRTCTGQYLLLDHLLSGHVVGSWCALSQAKWTEQNMYIK